MPLMKTRKMLMNEINETTQDFIGELLSDYAPYQWGLISRMNHEDLNKLSSRMAELLSQQIASPIFTNTLTFRFFLNDATIYP